MNRLILIRGLPGSGKSTLARRLLLATPDTLHLEADMYHIDEEGQYNFKVENIKNAHAWCQANTLRALNKGKTVIVSNTFTQLWELEPYFNMAPYTIITMENQFGNIHGVPEEVITKMKERWEPIP